MELMKMKSFAKVLNDQTFTDYYYRLMLLARSVFKWENLPNMMNERWIEKFLFEKGYCVVYNDPMRGLMVSECTIEGQNNYKEPTHVTTCGIGVEPRRLTIGVDCVLIRNNDEMTPTSFTLQLFAYRLAEISRTIDINIRAQKTPVLIQGSEKQRISLKNAYNQWDENNPVIFADPQLDLQGITVMKTDAPKVFTDLQRQKIAIWNEALTFISINNANTEKRERMITDEVAANDVHIEMSGETMLKARQDGANDMMRVFGQPVKVMKREDVMEKCKQDTPNTSEL